MHNLRRSRLCVGEEAEEKVSRVMPNPSPLEPQTYEEWQRVADIAGGALVLRDARRYGLVVGGPVVNVARCEEILTRAAQLGVTPADNIDRFISLVLADGSQALESAVSEVQTPAAPSEPSEERSGSNAVCLTCLEPFALPDFPGGTYQLNCPTCNAMVTVTV